MSVVGESSPGAIVGDVTTKTNYRCPGCSHAWHGQEATRRAAVCPACVQPVAGTEHRREVVGTVTRTERQPFIDEHYVKVRGSSERTGHTIRFEPVPVRYEASVGVFRCEHCSHEWRAAEQERRVG